MILCLVCDDAGDNGNSVEMRLVMCDRYTAALAHLDRIWIELISWCSRQIDWENFSHNLCHHSGATGSLKMDECSLSSNCIVILLCWHIFRFWFCRKEFRIILEHSRYFVHGWWITEGHWYAKMGAEILGCGVWRQGLGSAIARGRHS